MNAGHEQAGRRAAALPALALALGFFAATRPPAASSSVQVAPLYGAL